MVPVYVEGRGYGPAAPCSRAGAGWLPDLDGRSSRSLTPRILQSQWTETSLFAALTSSHLIDCPPREKKSPFQDAVPVAGVSFPAEAASVRRPPLARRRSLGRSRLTVPAGASQRVNVDTPAPRFSAISRLVRPLVRTGLTASSSTPSSIVAACGSASYRELSTRAGQGHSCTGGPTVSVCTPSSSGPPKATGPMPLTSKSGAITRSSPSRSLPA